MTGDSPAGRAFLGFGHFVFRFRNALFPVVFATLFFFSKPKTDAESGTLDFILLAAGIVCLATGQAFRLAVIGYAYIKRGGKDGKVYADHLVVRGFYAHSRNPMYVGNLLIVTGACLMYGSFWAYGLMLPFFFLAYLSIVVAEEDYLRRKFGKEYEDYEKRVNRFWPDFRGLGASLAEFRYDWKRALRKDYGTIFTTLASIHFVLGWRRYAAEGVPTMLERLVWNPFFAAGLVFYLFCRYLKKSGRLASSN